MTVRTIIGDCRDVLPTLPAASVHCIVTSPPYFGLRDYGVSGQIGLEPTPDAYVAELVGVFRECRRVLRDDGTLWLNLGDSYSSGGRNSYGAFCDPETKQATHVAIKSAVRPPMPQGIKPKDLLGIPWRVAFALQADGWYLRSDIIWSKPNPMPESVTDRPTKAHEYLFLLSKLERYFYDADAIAEPFADARMGNPNGGGHYVKQAFAYAGPNAQSGLQSGKWNVDGSILSRNRRSVWTVATQPFSEAHFATFLPALIEPCIKAGCPLGGTVLDPFSGAGTTGLVADRLQRSAVLIELNPDYASMSGQRIRADRGALLDIMEMRP